MSAPNDILQRIQALAQELQDQIFLCFLVVKPEHVTVDDRYKPPVQLQINRQIRKEVAKQYYSTSTFVVLGFSPMVPPRFHRWLRAMPAEHNLMIKDIRRLTVGRDSYLFGDRDAEIRYARRAAAAESSEIYSSSAGRPVELQETALKWSVYIKRACENCGKHWPELRYVASTGPLTPRESNRRFCQPCREWLKTWGIEDSH